MKIHILQIPDEGKHIEGEDPATALDLQESNVQVIAPLSYALDVGLSEGGLFATGRLWTAFRCECVSCLTPFEFPVEVPDFACQVELDGREEVDLTDTLREDILLALPAHPHCDGFGGRTCPGPPKSSLSDSPGSQAETTPPARKVWGELDRLEF